MTTDPRQEDEYRRDLELANAPTIDELREQAWLEYEATTPYSRTQNRMDWHAGWDAANRARDAMREAERRVAHFSTHGEWPPKEETP